MAIQASYADFFGALLLMSSEPQSFYEAHAAGQRINAGSASSQLSDGEVAAVLNGGPADDRFYVSHPGAVVSDARGGVDTVYSWRNFSLPANVENLVLQDGSIGRGNALANILIADSWGKQLIGGHGDDVLVDSGEGGVVFEFEAGSGFDAIYGFVAQGEDHDIIRLRDYDLHSFDQIRSAMKQVGGDVILSLSASASIAIKGVKLADLTAQNFQLPLDKGQLSLTFQDEFDQLSLLTVSRPDGTWKPSFPFGDQTGPQAYDSRTLSASDDSIMIYVDPEFAGRGTKPLGIDPFSVQDGVLTITAERTPSHLRSQLWDYDFTSGLITTEQSFTQTYGYFEMRAKVPLVEGAWPAFWLLSADVSWPPEIDVMEHIGGDEVYFSLHSDVDDHHTSKTFSLTLEDLDAAFHTYGVLWTPTSLTWYLDGTAVASAPTPDDMHKPMYMLANLAVGGGWAGDPDKSTTAIDFEIDYIRAYSLGAPSGPPSGSSADTAQSLEAKYRSILLTEPQAAQLAGWASEIDSGVVRYDQVVGRLVDLADATTSVATLTYQFFTGATPSAAGLNYLLSPANPNSLNGGYYDEMSLENRYINFAVNLGTIGAGRADFAADFGHLSLKDATLAAYGYIFGVAADGAWVESLLSAPVLMQGRPQTRADYFAAFGPDELAAKAAMVGWLLAEAAKSDTGLLAEANEAYLLSGHGGQVDLTTFDWI